MTRNDISHSNDDIALDLAALNDMQPHLPEHVNANTYLGCTVMVRNICSTKFAPFVGQFGRIVEIDADDDLSLKVAVPGVGSAWFSLDEVLGLPFKQPLTPGAYLITDAQLDDLMQAAGLLTCACEEPQAQRAQQLVRGVVKAARKVGSDPDTFGPPQPEQAPELSTEQVPGFAADFTSEVVEQMSGEMERVLLRYLPVTGEALDEAASDSEFAMLIMAGLYQQERTAHAATRTENARLKVALAEAEAGLREIAELDADPMWRGAGGGLGLAINAAEAALQAIGAAQAGEKGVG